jgi:anaerobic magnesium-protoporphyrin IX monomethyl ester cyclase
MARIAFIQNLAYEYLGTMYLSAVLKAAGHHADVFILEKTEDELVQQVLGYQPDIAAFSVTTGIHLWATEFAERLKSVRNVPTIFGGPHPTYFPELIHHPAVDMICRGEGEEAIVELADAIDRKEPFAEIKNLWVKCGDQIVKNDLRRLVSDLDALPHPDRSLYRDKYAYLNKSVGTFMAGRGCPHRCSFCFNHAAQKMYAGLGRYLRLRKPEKVVEEIVETASTYKLRTIYVQDDTILLNKK